MSTLDKPLAPLVSVIIPTYNRAWILKEALDSVAGQTYRDFELIVVDDGSDDDTADMVRRHPAPIELVQQPNRGVSAARNRGIQTARGELIAFLDSDDYWLPQKLAVQTAFFTSRPQALICQTEEIWIRNGVRVNPKKRHRKPSGRIFEASLKLCLVSPSAVMIRRHLFDAVGFFDETLPACEDYDLWLRIAAQYPVELIDRPLIVKRGGHEDQLSKMAGLDKFRIQSIVRLLAGESLTASQQRAARKTLREKCIIYANGCDRRGRTEEAEAYRRLALDHACGLKTL